ncbi:hypothetical protein CPB83DRAFT_854508 [Crepidotus variabilis]|uniref:Transmembrane protein n=1 Tax=Crepidotus variabilis TaxID=179855 RepID=A0A9P6JPN9_9AGAR|nr:hypothetical protein CPB83DRAFT_854508 [Crepidotus variabilis]
MTDWKAVDVQQDTLDVFVYVLHALTGVYIWEFLVTSDIECNVLFGRRTSRWPLIIYVLSRYCTLVSLILGVLMFDIGSPSLDCRATYIVVSVLSYISLGLASVNLAIRTIAIWTDNKYVTRSLCLIICVLWCLVIIQLATSFVTAARISGGRCLPGTKNKAWVLTTYVYSLFINSIITALTVWKLRERFGLPTAIYSQILFREGVGFYMIVFLFDLVAIVMLILNLNIAMSAIFVVSAQVAVTVVACRAVRSLCLKLRPPPEIVGGNWTQSFPIDLHTINTQQLTHSKTINSVPSRHQLESPSASQERSSKGRDLDLYMEPRHFP